MNALSRSILLGAAGLITAFQASAAAVTLADYAFNIDGVVNAAPGGLGGSFDYSTGFGTITLSVTGAGTHYVGLFLDHDIDEQINTFYNEFGSVSGAPVAGQSWQIDEPELADPTLGPWFYKGNIFSNFSGSALDGTNHVPAAGLANDVSLALAWSFSLGAGDTAYISFAASEAAPGGGFYLTQTDPHSQSSVYLASNLRIGNGGTPVPEPASMALVAVGLMAAWQARRKPARI
jgi:hypothetical protein